MIIIMNIVIFIVVIVLATLDSCLSCLPSLCWHSMWGNNEDLKLSLYYMHIR